MGEVDSFSNPKAPIAGYKTHKEAGKYGPFKGAN